MDKNCMEFTFPTYAEAQLVLNKSKSMASECGFISLANISKFTTYDFSAPFYNYICWTVEALNESEIHRIREGYALILPAPDYFDQKQCMSPEPINISICIDSIKNPKHILEVAFNLANQIKDRSVHITIS